MKGEVSGIKTITSGEVVLADPNAMADEKLWKINLDGSRMALRLLDDSNSYFSEKLVIERIGTEWSRVTCDGQEIWSKLKKGEQLALP